MAKGDDALARKKNKSTRKKMNRKNDSATVSTRIASIIAAKKRRKSGKRSMCQGMCFSLPTPEDPFNERQSKVDITKKKTKKAKSRDTTSEKDSYRSAAGISREVKRPSLMCIDSDDKKWHCEDISVTGGFVTVCMNEIESSFHRDGIYNDDQLENSWFNVNWIEFWQCFSSGKDVLETSGTSANREQIAWIASIAADVIARQEKNKQEESISNSPFLLFLVSSQSKASMVRSVCKALKNLGIHAVSLHQGASIDHQISGLKSCEPEFIISTPERLLEIINLKGVDISGVSLLVIDELGSLCTGGYLDAVKSIKEAITSKHRSILFNDSYSASYIPAVQSLLKRPICRVALKNSVASRSAYIIQTVNVCASVEKKLQKFSEILDSSSSKNIYIVTKEESFRELKALLKLKGFSVSAKSEDKTSEVKKSRKPSARFIDMEELDTTVLEEFETVLLPDFVPSIDTYIKILKSMARNSVYGVLESFVTEKEAAATDMVGELVTVLEDCGQMVPQPWKSLSTN